MSDKETDVSVEETTEKSYDDLFAEVSAEVNGEEVEKVEPEEDVQPETPDEPEQEEEQEEDVPDEKDESQEPPPENKEDEPKPDDPYANLPAEVVAELNRLKHVEKSNSGRVRGLSEALKKARAEKEKIEQVMSEKSRLENIDIDDDDEMKELAEQFPNIYKSVKASQQATIRKALELAKPIEDTSVTAPDAESGSDVDMTAEIEKLDAAVSNWRDISGHAFFNQFLEAQPPAIQKMANSDNADDLIYLFKEVYEPYRSSVYQADEAATPTEEAAPDAGTKSEAADKAKARRDKALKEKKDLDSTTAGRTVSDSDGNSYEQLFNAVAKKRNAS